MGNITEATPAQYDATVRQIEETDTVQGGAGSATNAPLINLANRTKYLKSKVDGIIDGTIAIVSANTSNSLSYSGALTTGNLFSGTSALPDNAVVTSVVLADSTKASIYDPINPQALAKKNIHIDVIASAGTGIPADVEAGKLVPTPAKEPLAPGKFLAAYWGDYTMYKRFGRVGTINPVTNVFTPNEDITSLVGKGEIEYSFDYVTNMVNGVPCTENMMGGNIRPGDSPVPLAKQLSNLYYAFFMPNCNWADWKRFFPYMGLPQSIVFGTIEDAVADGGTFLGDWNTNTTYDANDVVKVGEVYYAALCANTGQSPSWLDKVNGTSSEWVNGAYCTIGGDAAEYYDTTTYADDPGLADFDSVSRPYPPRPGYGSNSVVYGGITKIPKTIAQLIGAGYNNTVFKGSISGTTLTVITYGVGPLRVGQPVLGVGVTVGTVITAFLTAATNPGKPDEGGAGTYTVNILQEVEARAMGNPAINGYIEGNILTVTKITADDGTKFGVFPLPDQPLAIGYPVIADGVTQGTVITALGNNTTGGLGTYTVSISHATKVDINHCGIGVGPGTCWRTTVGGVDKYWCSMTWAGYNCDPFAMADSVDGSEHTSGGGGDAGNAAAHKQIYWRVIHRNGAIVPSDSELWQRFSLKFPEIRTANPNLKFCLSLGGWSRGHYLSVCCHDDDIRAVTVDSCLGYCKRGLCDGIDMDWESPGGASCDTHNVINGVWPDDPNTGSNTPEGLPGYFLKRQSNSDPTLNEWDKDAYTWIIRDLRAAFDTYKTAGGRYLEVSCASSMGDNILYAEMESFQYMDWVQMMSYIFYGTWQKYQYPFAGLYMCNPDTHPDLDKGLTVHGAAQRCCNAHDRAGGDGKLGTLRTSFVGSIANNILTVTALNSKVPSGTTITGFVSGTNGGIGVYTLSCFLICRDACYLTDTGMWGTTDPTVAFVGSVSGSTLTVTYLDFGTITVTMSVVDDFTISGTAPIIVGMPVYGKGVALGTNVIALGSGTGGLGTYVLNNVQNVSSRFMGNPTGNTTAWNKGTFELTVPKEKVIIGTTTNGSAYNNYGFSAPAVPGVPGGFDPMSTTTKALIAGLDGAHAPFRSEYFSGSPGFQDSDTLMYRVLSGDVTRYWDPYSKTCTCVKEWGDGHNEVLSIEDSTALWHKANYVVQNGYGGMMVWETSGDSKNMPDPTGWTWAAHLGGRVVDAAGSQFNCVDAMVAVMNRGVTGMGGTGSGTVTFSRTDSTSTGETLAASCAVGSVSAAKVKITYEILGS